MNNSPASRPASGKTRRVWEIADTITRESGRRAKRGEVIEKFIDEGGNPNTANTQYQYWKAHVEAASGGIPANDPNPPPTTVQLKEAGRIVVPAELRAALNIGEGDTLTARVIDGEIRLMPLSTAISRAQALVREFVPANVSLVDELLDDRRRENLG